MANSIFKPLPLNKQTIVITGASYGIGLATARLAAERGANVVMASRSGEELQKCADDIRSRGGKVLAVSMDVTKMGDLARLRDQALATFGQINTWVNNAGVSLHGYLMESDPDEEKKLFDTNFWGTRFGSSIAVEEMAEKGGTLINMGSETSAGAKPLLGIYSASKYAVKGFTDSLRVELRDRKIPVEVCLIRPTDIEAPFDEQAAEAILECAVHPRRDVYVGGPARLSAILDTFFPSVKDIVSESRMKELRKGSDQTSLKESTVKSKTMGQSIHTTLSSLGGALRQLKKS